MATVSEAVAAASSHFEAGRYQEAARICQQILAVDARCFAGWHLLGLIAHQVRQSNLALNHRGSNDSPLGAWQ